MPRPKRRAAEAFPEEMDVDPSHLVNITGEETQKPAVDEEKAEAIWSAVREEYHETVEQLPLAFQRLFVLIKEFETQSSDHVEELRLLLHSYIQQRKKLSDNIKQSASITHTPDVLASAEPNSKLLSDPLPMEQGLGETTTDADDTKNQHRAMKAVDGVSVLPKASSPHVSPPLAKPTHPLLLPHTPPALVLGRIAVLASLILTAADERMNTAESALHSLDRHLTLVDQGIKDAEASIALGIRNGTHPGGLVLPAIVAPSVRPQKALKAQPPPEPAAEPKKLKLTIRKPAAQTGADEGNDGPWCYCNQGSYGEMILCDNEDNCERQWFHFGCIGMKKSPAGKWYCRECKTAQRLAPIRKR